VSLKAMETDLLVIGGGIGGPFAAMFASEAGARVILLEKAAVRRSGACGMGIGSWHQMTSEDITLDDVAGEIMASGGKLIGSECILPMNKGLVDENLNYIGYRDNWEVVHTLEKWGVNMRWDDGKYYLEGDNLRFHGGQLKKGIDRALKKSAVTVLERTMGIDLLTKDGVIAGATALNVRTGKLSVIRAKMVMLATGTVSRIYNPWHNHSQGKFKMLYHYHAGSGDGVAMAYKVGAELVNFEIGGIGAGVIGVRLADKTIYSHPSVFPDIACDSQGNFVKGIMDADKEFQIKREGHDPCYADFRGKPEDYYQYWQEYNENSIPIHWKFQNERGLDARTQRMEVASFKPEHNSSISGLAFDENGRTSVDRLYAVGDMVGGTTFLGAANAAVFGMRAGKQIGSRIADMELVDIDEAQVAEQKKIVFAPKKVKRGVEPLEVELKIRDLVERYCGPERSESSIERGLWRLKAVKDRFLPELVANDNHELMTTCEVRNLFLLAELFMLCAKERKESGMRTYRMDYPELKDVPWKEALVAKLEGDEIKFSRKRLPDLRDEFRPK
jgi:succinate dehydrogenase/fumarate reductase flavoprotein subunit